MEVFMKFSRFFILFLLFSQLSHIQAIVIKNGNYRSWDQERQAHFEQFNKQAWRMYGLGLLSGALSVECLNHQKLSAASLFGKAAIGCFASGIALSVYSNVDIKERRLKYEARQRQKDAVVRFVKSEANHIKNFVINYQPANDAMEQHLLQQA
jgi:hypothetical protein